MRCVWLGVPRYSTDVASVMNHAARPSNMANMKPRATDWTPQLMFASRTVGVYVSSFQMLTKANGSYRLKTLADAMKYAVNTGTPKSSTKVI